MINLNLDWVKRAFQLLRAPNDVPRVFDASAPKDVLTQLASFVGIAFVVPLRGDHPLVRQIEVARSIAAIDYQSGVEQALILLVAYCQANELDWYLVRDFDRVARHELPSSGRQGPCRPWVSGLKLTSELNDLLGSSGDFVFCGIASTARFSYKDSCGYAIPHHLQIAISELDEKVDVPFQIHHDRIYFPSSGPEPFTMLEEGGYRPFFYAACRRAGMPDEDLRTLHICLNGSSKSESDD